jgi:hypothetical protein
MSPSQRAKAFGLISVLNVSSLHDQQHYSLREIVTLLNNALLYLTSRKEQVKYSGNLFVMLH